MAGDGVVGQVGAVAAVVASYTLSLAAMPETVTLKVAVFTDLAIVVESPTVRVTVPESARPRSQA